MHRRVNLSCLGDFVLNHRLQRASQCSTTTGGADYCRELTESSAADIQGKLLQ
jgi:hypothetical protein